MVRKRKKRTLNSGLTIKRKIRVKRRGVPSNSNLSMDAIERLIESKTSNLQDQIKILQSNAINTMVIFGDMRNSVALAGCSSESTKRVLTDLIENLDKSFSTISEFVGAPSFVESNTHTPLGDTTIDLNASGVMTIGEALERANEVAQRLVEGGVEIPAQSSASISEDGDDIIENLSEEYEEYSYWSEEEGDTVEPVVGDDGIVRMVARRRGNRR